MPEAPGDKLLEDGLDANDIFEDEEWEEGAEVAAPPLPAAPGIEGAPRARQPSEKPLRQRIEEYFERKRLEQALDEELSEDIFKY